MSTATSSVTTSVLAMAVLLASSANVLGVALEGEVEVIVVDKTTSKEIAVRMHLKDRRGRPVIPRGTVGWKDHFVFNGRILLKLRPGAYTFELERGPEYRVRSGHFMIERGAEDTHTLELERFVDMKKEGWWCGDLHVHRPLKDIELLMRAEDLHIAPVITWWNKNNAWAETQTPDTLLHQFDTNRFYHVMAGEDEREGGALLYFNLDQPLPIQDADREFPSPVQFLDMAREHASAHIDIEKPFWWDMPTWVATGKIDSIGLANNHMCRSEVLGNEAWGKPRDTKFYPGTHGNGRWTQDIYYHLLNCGLRIPPSAGSASGVLPNPVGYNRVYVHCEGELTYDKWFEGLREGKVVVTNGPLLRPRVNGQLPGHVFTASQGETIELRPSLNLSVREKVEYLEIVKNGRVEREVRLAEYKAAGWQLPTLEFEESGWMLIRAVTNNQDTFRFASTGPYYVEIGQQPRISKASAQFFHDWVYERARRIKIEKPERRDEVIEPHRAARDFWKDLIGRANVD